MYLSDKHADVEAGRAFCGNQSSTRLDVGRSGRPYPSGLVSGEIYFWRIDVIDGDYIVYTGNIWCFKVTNRSYTGKVYNLKIAGSDQYMVGKDSVIVRDF